MRVLSGKFRSPSHGRANVRDQGGTSLKTLRKGVVRLFVRRSGHALQSFTNLPFEVSVAPRHRRPVCAIWSLAFVALVLTPSQDASAQTKLAAPGPTSWASFRNGLEQRGVAGGTLPEKLNLKWKMSVADGVVTTSAIVGEHVYVPSLNGTLYCLKKETGEVVWTYRSIDDPDPKTFAAGFKSAPTVTADVVYCGDEDGLLHCVERVTGKKKGIFKTGAEIAGAAAVLKDQVIVGSHDGFLYSVKPDDGSLRWKFQTQDRINCSVAIAGKYTFIAGCDQHLRVIDIETGKEASDVDFGSYLIASPAILGDMLYVGTHAAEVVAFDWKKKEIVWRYKDPKREFPYHSSAVVTDEVVIVGGQDKQMHCIQRLTGEGVWTFQARGRIDSSPALVGNRVFFGSADRNLYAVDMKSGKEVWKFNCGGEVKAGPAVGEGVLVIGTEGQQGTIYCFGK